MALNNILVQILNNLKLIKGSFLFRTQHNVCVCVCVGISVKPPVRPALISVPADLSLQLYRRQNFLDVKNIRAHALVVWSPH
jgi:hypothetical protein